jgi:hypothetical protein
VGAQCREAPPPPLRLDEAFVLRQLKAIAKNGEVLGNANLNDCFVRNDAGQLIGIDLSNVPPRKIAALEEVTVEQVVEGRGEDRQAVRRTKIKLRSAAAVIQANELLGRYLGLWEGKGQAEVAAAGKKIIEVYWRGTAQETPQVSTGSRTLSQQPTSGVLLENLQRSDGTAAGDGRHLEDRGPRPAADGY